MAGRGHAGGVVLKSFSTTPGKLYYSNPTVVAVLSVREPDGVNFMPAAWNTPVSRNPPLFAVAVAPSRYSFEILEEAGEFGVSFLGFDSAAVILATGGISGRELSKIKALGIGLRKPKIIRTPLILQSYAGYECSLQRTVTLGDHVLVVGEIRGVHWDPRAFQRGLPKWTAMRPALYLGADRFLAPLPLAEVKLDRSAAAENLRIRSLDAQLHRHPFNS